MDDDQIALAKAAIDAELTRAFRAWMGGDRVTARAHMHKARLHVVDAIDVLEGNFVTNVDVDMHLIVPYAKEC